MALSDMARMKLAIACGDPSVGAELQTKMADITVANTVAGTQTFSGTVTLSGALDHDGTTVGFYGVTPTTRPTAYTQTYSTADKTHANPTATALTHSAVGGTADGTLVDCTNSYSEAAVEENFKECATAINAIIVDLADLKQLVNSVIDDLQAIGLLQ